MTRPPLPSGVVVAAAIVALLLLAAVAGWRIWPATGAVREIPVIALEGADPEIAEVVQSARDAVEQSPRSAEAWGQLAMVLHAHAFENSADICYQAASELDPRNATWPYLRGALLHDGPGGPEAAIPLFAQAANLSPPNSVARLKLAEMLLESGQIEDANREYLAVLANDPSDAHALLGLGAVAVAQRRYRDSLKYLEPIAKQSTVQKQACRLLATVWEQLGETNAAEQERQRMSMLPNDSQRFDDPMNQVSSRQVGLTARLREANQLRQEQRLDATIAALRETVLRHPTAEEAWANLGMALYYSGNPNEAERAMQRSVELAPKSTEYRYNLGMLQLRQEQFEEAAITFQKCLELRPTFAPAHFGLGECLLATGKTGEAAKAYRAALQYLPDHPEARERLLRLPEEL